MFSLRYLLHVQVRMMKRRLNMDLELEERFGLVTWI